MTDFKFPKKEKLKQKRETTLLFEKGKWFTSGKLRIIYLDLEKKPQEDFLLPNQKLGVSAAKRNFKKAVDRNRIKRLLRESYRLNKDIYTAAFGNQSLAMLFWISSEKPGSFQEVESEFLKLCASKK